MNVALTSALAVGLALVLGLTLCCGVAPAAEQMPATTGRRTPAVITIRPEASGLELLAAHEVRRYVYLRTGKVLPVKRGAVGGDRIVVTCKNRKFCDELGQDLGPQQFTLRTSTAGGAITWSVVGGDEVGTL